MESQIIKGAQTHRDKSFASSNSQDTHAQSSGLPSFSLSPVPGLPLQRKCVLRILTFPLKRTFPQISQIKKLNREEDK